MRTVASRHDRGARALAALVVPMVAVLLMAGGCAADPGSEASSPPSEAPRASSEPVAVEPALAGETFTDPGGRYTLTVPASWEPHHGIAGEGIEVWRVAKVKGDFAPNINVITEDVTGMSLKDYMTLSFANAPQILSDFKLLKSSVVTSAAGQDLGVIEYSARGLRYVGVVALGSMGAVVVTFSSTPDRFAAIVDDVYPYMVTLQPTGI
ncbi:MAG TPA: hypothetical protein VGK35_09260 [Actinotalea sp.]